MTEPDSTRHNATTQLSDRQIAAIEALVAAGTQTDAALAAGVTRQTVNEWVNHHYGFIAELNRLRTERLQACADTLQSTVAQAVELVSAQIANGDVAIAMGLLKIVKVDHLRTVQTGEPSSPEEVRKRKLTGAYIELLQENDSPDFVATKVDRRAKRAFDGVN